MGLDAERKLVYALLVAGKTYKFAQSKLAALENELVRCGHLRDGASFFDGIRNALQTNSIDTILREVRTGNYRKLCRALAGILELDLATCGAEELEQVYGVGPKTARFWLMWARDEDHVALDVHILRWLRERGYPDIPQQTPQSAAVYARIAEIGRAHV